MKARCSAMLLCLLACGDTGQAHVRIPAAARGTTRSELNLSGTRFSLSRAEVGFGPAYFCATEGAEVELCEVARAELLETVTLDGLAGEERPFGELSATTGSVRSALFDYGISWQLTRSAPSANAGAPGGHSAILEGQAENERGVLRFSARIDIAPLSRGGRGGQRAGAPASRSRRRRDSA